MDCSICGKELLGLQCQNKWCREEHYECSKCRKVINGLETYEYRGAIACEGCFEEVAGSREFERQEVIEAERSKTECFKGLDMSPSTQVGKANRRLLKGSLEVARKPSGRLLEYEKN